LIIRYEKHAERMLMKRSCKCGIHYFESSLRVKETVLYGRLSSTKQSRKNIVYYKYFNDNLSFFVICRGFKDFLIIKTVIIKRGRE